MQSMKVRLGLSLALLLLAAFAGLYLSGYLTLLLLKLKIPLEWNTWWQYYKALEVPQFQPFATKIKLAGALGFGAVFLLWLPLAVLLLRGQSESLHGEAHFADKGDLRKAGFLEATPQGILLGKAYGQYLYLNGTQHVIVTAATRTGKTAGIAIPVLFTYDDSVVCSDLKGELHQLTSAERQRKGHAIYKFAPYDETGETHRFNPFTALPDDPAQRYAEVLSMAAILYPDEGGKDPFWPTMARNAFTAFAMFLFENWDDLIECGFPGTNADGELDPQARMDPNTDPSFPSFERIMRLSTGSDGEGAKKLIERWLSNKNGRCRAFISPQTRTNLQSLVGLADETFSSVLATMQAPLQQFLSPILAAATNASDFDVRQLRRKKMTIYMVIPPKKLGESRKLLNIFFSTAIGGNLDRQSAEDKSIKHQVLMLMDEFATMGRVDAVADRISIAAGYWVRFLVIVQSLSQLRSIYGADMAQNIVVNHGASAVFTPREQEDANLYSEMLGYRTIRRKMRSYSHGAQGRTVNINYTEERRALMLPQEVKELPKDDLLLFYEGCPPIRAKKNWWFKDNKFKALVRDPVTTPRMAVRKQKSGAPRQGQGNGKTG